MESTNGHFSELLISALQMSIWYLVKQKVIYSYFGNRVNLYFKVCILYSSSTTSLSIMLVYCINCTKHNVIPLSKKRARNFWYLCFSTDIHIEVEFEVSWYHGMFPDCMLRGFFADAITTLVSNALRFL